jgi:hypothetical protein
MVSVALSQITFVDGSVEELPTDGVVVVVGPNNAGKSVLLGEIAQRTETATIYEAPRWLSSVAVERTGGEAEFQAWFEARARVGPEGYPHAGQSVIGDPMQGPGIISLEQGLRSWFSSGPLDAMMPYFARLYDAMSRPNLLQGAQARNVMQAATDPLHRIWDDRELEAAISRTCERAFGFTISINRYAQQLEVLVGKPGLPDEVPPVSVELLEQYAKLHPVRMQGDGIRSFVGLVVAIFGSGHSISIVDEPEAFLHPPQARMLGTVFSESATYGPRQIFVATHSDDMLEGILDGAGNREVKVIRVADRRRTGSRSASVLPTDEVRSLWSDPLLRYSRMLDGLFHQGVVVCEADSDCTVYRAVLDATRGGQFEHDLIFTHVGGKGRLDSAVSHLRNLSLRVAVIADLDVLREPTKLDSLIVAAGGDPLRVRDDLKVIRGQIDGRSGAATVRSLKDAVQAPLRRRDGSAITDSEAAAVQAALKSTSGWREVKRSGIGSFEGEAFSAVDRVLAYLQELGLFLVTAGELERWYPEIQAGHGASYATAVLESGKHLTPAPSLRGLMDSVCTFFGIGQARALERVETVDA